MRRKASKVLIFYITNVCNFKCKTCLREYGPHQNLDEEILENLLPEAKKLGYHRVAFTGGEPCLHPQFKKLVRMVVDSNMKFGFVSNGSLLENYKFTIDDFKENMFYAAFSLDGATAEVHDSVRQQGSFEKVVESIKYFVSRGVNTKVVMCINKLNMHQIEEVVDLSTNLGAKKVRFGSAIPTRFNKDIVLSNMEKIRCALLINRMKNRYKIPLEILSALRASSNRVDFCSQLNATNQITINPYGEAMFCCDTICNGAVIGSVKETGLTEIFCKMQDIMADIKKARARMIRDDKTPPYFNTCEFCNNYLANYIK